MSARFKPYPKYIDSGVEWLGRIPAHWSTKRLKRACKHITDGSHFSPPAQYNGKPYVTVTNLVDGRVDLGSAAKISDEDFAKLERSGCRPKVGDVLFSKDGTVGKVAVAERDDFVILSSLAILRPAPEVYPQYLGNFLKSKHGTTQIESNFAGAALKRITLEVIVDLAAIVPPRSEQVAIASFLDREAGKIDALVKKKERFLELLLEQRAALIGHAVTQGLNPSAPKKDSGIPWLGQMPKHWHLKKIGYFTSVGNGSTPERGNVAYWDGGDYPWLNSSVVNDEHVTESPDFVTAVALRECHLPIVSPGSVLVAITGEGKTRGKAAILQFEATINQHLAYITPNATLANGNFLRAALASRYDVLRFLSEGGGSTKGALTCEQLKQFKIPLPPLDEQRAIVQYIDQETAKLDALMAKVRTAIERLQEYRTALISAAVTGQIDVRGSVSTL